MKILALKWRRLGDTILWTAALDALRKQFPASAGHQPGHQIDIAFPSAYADLFVADTRFDHRFALTDENAAELARGWRATGYDLALGFHVSPKVRKLLKAARAKETILHHHDRSAKNFGSDRRVVALGHPMAAIERDLNVVRTIGWQGESPVPRLLPDPAWREAARAQWPNSAKPRVLLGPAASRPAKQWPLERFAQLAEALKDRAEVGVIYDHENAFRGHTGLRARLAKQTRLNRHSATERSDRTSTTRRLLRRLRFRHQTSRCRTRRADGYFFRAGIDRRMARLRSQAAPRAAGCRRLPLPRCGRSPVCLVRSRGLSPCLACLSDLDRSGGREGCNPRPSLLK